MKTPSPSLIVEAFVRTQMNSTYGVTTTLPALRVEDQKRLPKDNWGGKNLWVTASSFGSGFFIGVPVRRSVVSVTTWCKPLDRRRHWGAAEALGESLIELGTDWTTNMLLGMPYPNYVNVSLSSFTPTSGLRRIENDPQGLARVEFDVEICYTILKPSMGNPSSPVPISPATGGTLRFDFDSQLQWNVDHSLGYYPLIQLFDVDGNEIEGQLTQLNTSHFVITFNSPRAGFAIVR